MTDELGPSYDGPADNDTNGWVEIPLDTLMRPRLDGRPIPFQMFINRFKSSSPDFELFLHDPLRQMASDADLLGSLTVPGFDVGNITPNDPKWHLSTTVANHHRRLNRIHAYAPAIFGPDGVHIMVYKDADPDP